MTSVAFFVPGAPSAQGSKRHVGNGVLVDMNRELRPWRDSITWAARQAGQPGMFTEHVAITLDAVYARPKSHYRSGRNAHLLRESAPTWKTSAPDADKVARAALDAITASGLWRDDAQVAALHVTKRYGDQPGLAVHITDEECSNA